MPLKLVNPQPMENLPTNGDCLFAEVTNNYDERYVTIVKFETFYKDYYKNIYPAFHAWSYTATFEEVGG